MLAAVLLRYPIASAYICINIAFTILFSKTTYEIIGSLIPENIRIDILMSPAYIHVVVIRSSYS